MVVFTCNHCGESLQKPRVEKHYYTTCRHKPKSLTCVDCLKDFRLEEFTSHTQCVSETERYSAKGTVIAVPKGKKKQESWVETVHNVLAQEKNNVHGNIKKVFELLLNSNNVPKKQKPFTNFILNSTGNRINQKDIEVVWNIIENHAKNNSAKQINESKDNEDNENNSKNNQTIEETQDSKKSKQNKKKSKDVETNDNNVTEEHQENEDNSKTEMNGEINDSKKSKKKKKSKEVETNDDNDTEKHQENEDNSKENELNEVINGTKKSKKNKKKSKEVESNSNTDTEKHQENETINKEESETNTTKKSKKKKSKDKSEESILTNLDENKTLDEAMDIQVNKDEQVKENSKQKKKRKAGKETVENGINKAEDESPTKKIKTNEKDPEMHLENIIIGILTKKPDGITKEKLKNKFLKKLGKEPTEDNKKLIKKFNKKLQILQNISCDDDLVKLIV